MPENMTTPFEIWRAPLSPTLTAWFSQFNVDAHMPQLFAQYSRMNVGFDLQKPNAVHPAHSDAYLAASMHGNVVVVVVVVVVVGGQMPHDRGQNEGYCRIEPSRSAGKHRLALLPLQPPATLKPRLLANAWSPASSLTTPFKHAGVVVVVAVSVDVVAVVVVVCVAVVVVVVLEVAVVVVVVVVVDDVHSPPLSASTACSNAARVFSNEAWSKMPKVAKPSASESKTCVCGAQPAAVPCETPNTHRLIESAEYNASSVAMRLSISPPPPSLPKSGGALDRPSVKITTWFTSYPSWTGFAAARNVANGPVRAAFKPRSVRENDTPPVETLPLYGMVRRAFST